MSEVKVVEVRAQNGCVDPKKFIEIILKNNEMLLSGWALQETREQAIEEYDQRDGTRKRFIGWLFIYVR